MSSRELMLLLSSFIRANNILVHNNLNDMLDLSRHDAPKMVRAIVRGPTVDDEMIVEQIELWATGQKHDEPNIPRCFTRDNLRRKRVTIGPNSTLYRVDQEDRSSVLSELVCSYANGDIPCYFDHTDPPGSAKM